jgi:hypothetical protein
MWATLLKAVGPILAAIITSLVTAWQSRADQRQLGEDDAERVTDTTIDHMEATQDAVDSTDRGGAVGVLARLRQHRNGTASGSDGKR